MSDSSSLKNQFLLAMPNQTGTYFGNSITYICEHNDDGAMGLVVNKPTDTTLLELLGQLGVELGNTPANVPVLAGGPVSTERGFILHSNELNLDTSLDLGNELMLTTAREVLEAIANDVGPEHYLVCVGYAGWGSGQLEDELAENAWLTVPASFEVLFRTPFEDRVNKAAAQLGIDFRLMAHQAGHA